MADQHQHQHQHEIQKKLQELQILEQNLQGLLMQKQAFQMELNQTLNALKEVEKTDDDVYKMAGSIMLKTEKTTVIKELEEKKKILELRTNAIEKQETLLNNKAEDLKKEAEKVLKPKN
jgi:prefoldin beta subunit